MIDFDRLAHEVQEHGKPGWQAIINHFGKEILQPDGKINRIKLGDIVFTDRNKLIELNHIVHPLVFQEWHDRLKKISGKEKHAIILSDVPLLFEVNMQQFFDLTILVVIEPEEQISRLISRNKVCREEAQRRLNSQMPIGEKIALADVVIDNQGSISKTEKKVRDVWLELLQREKQKNIH